MTENSYNFHHVHICNIICILTVKCYTLWKANYMINREEFEGLRGKIICSAVIKSSGEKFCKSLGKFYGSEGNKFNIYTM